MAGSSVLPPVRSINLPSRLHPTPLRIEEELNKPRKWEASSTSKLEPLGAETIRIGLVGLAELYNCVEEFIHSPANHHALFCHQDGEILEKVLDESVTFLDVCSTAKDILLMVREHVQALQLALRRKGAESSIQNYLGAYISFRKKLIKKDISKCLTTLKQTEKKMSSSSILVGVLREVGNVTITVLQSLMLFLSSPVMKTTKLGTCSLISKIMPVGFLSSEKGKKIVLNEVGSVDAALYALHQQARNNDFMFEVLTVQRKLESMAVCMDGLEIGLGCIYKCLIQYGVSLLNVLTH